MEPYEQFLDLVSAVAWLKRVKAGGACVSAQGLRWEVAIEPDGTASIKMLGTDPLHPEWIEPKELRGE
jgi:hypothetical protein